VEYRLYTKNGSLKKNILKIILDPKIRIEYKTLQKYLCEKSPEFSKTDLKILQEDVDSWVYDDLEYFCFLAYRYMELRGNWGDAGEQQAKASFCRNLLELAPDVSITTQNVMDFEGIVKTNIAKLGLENKTKAELAKEYDEFCFILFDIDFSIHDIEELGDIIAFVGSKYFLQGGYYGYDKEMILGYGKSFNKGAYKIIWLDKEVLRTPNTIVAMAAVIGNNQIFMRKESLATIFYQKWVYYLKQRELFTQNKDVYSEISCKIKDNTMALYNTFSSGEWADSNLILDYKQHQEAFIEDMGLTIMHHEIGHGLIQHDFLPIEIAALSEASKILGENIITSVLEVLADFAPKKGRLIGPFGNMVDVAQNDILRASRMFLMYFSDIWFFDTKDEYMYVYSDIMSLIMQKYLCVTKEGACEKAALNTVLLAEDIDVKNKDAIIKWLISSVIDVTSKLEALIQKASFQIGSDIFDFTQISKRVYKEHAHAFENLSEDAYQTKTLFWTVALDELVKCSVDKQEIMGFLAKEEKRILKELFIKIAGVDIAQEYDFDSRKFVVEKLLANLK
jgi:hypothetical protein